MYIENDYASTVNLFGIIFNFLYGIDVSNSNLVRSSLGHPEEILFLGCPQAFLHLPSAESLSRYSPVYMERTFSGSALPNLCEKHLIFGNDALESYRWIC